MADGSVGDKKSRWTSQISENLSRGDFTSAKDLAQQALAEFPDDPDLLSLEEKAIQGRELRVQAFQFMEEGKQLCAEENFEEAVQVLRSGLALDERNPTLRAALVDALLCQAQAVLEENVPLAEKLVGEALVLDPDNLVALSVARSIVEHKHTLAAMKAAPPNSNTPPGRPQSAPASISEGAKKISFQGAQPATIAQSGGNVASAVAPPASRVAGGTPPLGPDQPFAPNVVKPAASGASEVAGSSPRSSNSATRAGAPPLQSATPAGEGIAGSVQTSQAFGKVTDALPHPISQPVHSRVSERTEPRPRIMPAASAAAKRPSRGLPHWLWAAAAVVGLVAIAMLLRSILSRPAPELVNIPVQVRITPPGAILQVNGVVRDASNALLLPPGTYHLEARLDGYQPAERTLEVTRSFSDIVDLTLAPISQAIRISTDLQSGTVMLDERVVGNLQDGQFAIESITPGKHSLRIVAPGLGEALLKFESLPTAPPVLTEPISAKNVRVIAVSSYDTRGYVFSNSGPVPLSLDGKSIGTVVSTGLLELAGLTATQHQFVFGEGKQERPVNVDVNSGPGLFVSLNSDRNVGTLEIVANEDNFQVFLNGKAARAVKQRGRYFLYNVEAQPAVVQITKPGFQVDPPEARIGVVKGATTPIKFTLKAIPTTGTLRLSGLLAGTRVSIDGKEYDSEGNGAAEATLLQGDHIVELSRPGFKSKIIRTFVTAGQISVLRGPEVALEAPLTGKLVITGRNPSNVKLVLRRNGADFPVTESQIEIPEGDYLLIASAPGFHEKMESVHISEGNAASVDVKLAAIPQVLHMEGWEKPSEWQLQQGWYTRKGGTFVFYKPSSTNGVLQFVARPRGKQLGFFRATQLQWFVNYVDPNHYELYQIDENNISWRAITNGRPGPERKASHKTPVKDDTFQMQFEIASGTVVAKIFDGRTWKILPRLDDGGPAPPNARFGVYLPGNDELWIRDVEFRPKEQ